jgi:membrane protein YqaA with SNARE-associated domain
MHGIIAKFHQWEHVLLAFLQPLGFWGIGVLAAIDGGTIALPMDLVVAGYVWKNPRQFWVYAIVAGLGASIGALIPFFIGRAGGELVLTKRVNPEKYRKLQARFDRHHWFAVMVPAAMPPPFPFKLFAFGAGIFGMRVGPYMISVFVGRSVHYLGTATLVFFFGPEIMHLIVHGAKRHWPLIVLVAAILTAAYIYYVFRRRRRRRTQDHEEPVSRKSS